MRWNRTTIKAVVITFLTIIATSLFIKWTFDHDGETITLLTPGSTDRGARRIITGDSGEFYWTQDHYESFERIARRHT